MSTTQEQLRERYGTPGRTRRRVTIGVSALIAVLGLSWVAWAAWIQVTPEVQSSLSSFRLVDSHTVSADVVVKTRSRSVRASCLVRAYGADHSVVGELNFRVDDVSGTEVRRVQIRTYRPATAVDMPGCTAPGQKQAR